jgi:uncharacterized RDD family membrane protein YckC
MEGPTRDPREIITPDAFSVAPELLGTPLARPWRRGVAMGIDLVAIAVLGSVGWFLLGLTVAFLCFRTAMRPSAGVLGKSARVATFGSLGLFFLVLTIGGSWINLSDDDSPISLDTGSIVSGLGLAEVGGLATDVIAITGADTEVEMREATKSFAQRMTKQGAAPDEIREAVEELVAGKEEPWAIDAARAGLVDANLPAGEARSELNADSLAIAYAAAVQAGDSMQVAALREPVGSALAADRLESQQRRIETLQSSNARLEDDLESERDKGLIGLLLGVADEIGLGFGWAGLYFTIFLAYWGGRTPGKRLMRIRVVRLDGKPIGVWVSFNRFGGYAASVFTGLLGFFEMFWDRNRQALQDRIAQTVVMRDQDQTKPRPVG